MHMCLKMHVNDMEDTHMGASVVLKGVHTCTRRTHVCVFADKSPALCNCHLNQITVLFSSALYNN